MILKSTPLLTTTPVSWPLLCLSLALLPMAHPPAFWYTNQFELPCCKEKTRSTVIMFVKETFRLLLTMLIVTLSFTNGFIIIKISDDLPSYLLQSSSTYQRWRQCVSIVGEYSQENSPASKCKDNVIACVRGIRKFSWPTPTANHCRYEEKIYFFCRSFVLTCTDWWITYMVCNVQAKARCKIGSRGKLHQEWKKGHGQDAWDAWCMFCWERGRFFLLCHMQCTQMNVRAKHELLLSVVFWDANTILDPV